MGDPLKALHDEMLNRDLLEGPNRDYNTFSANLQDSAQRKRLYGVLEAEKWGLDGYDEFEKDFFSEPVKKKDGGSALPDGSSPPNAPAQNAGSDFGPKPVEEATFGVPPDPIDVLAGAENQVPEDRTLKNALQDSQMTASTLDVRARPITKLSDSEYTGDEDPLTAGRDLRMKREADFAYKEIQSGKSNLRQGTRDLATITMYADAARGQALNAAEGLKQKFGDDWEAQLTSLGPLVEEISKGQKPELSPDQAQAYIDRYNNIVTDPEYKKYSGGVKAQGKAQAEFNAYGAKNPEYARTLAKKKASQAEADDSILTSTHNWATGKVADVMANLASIPRTLIQATVPGAIENPVGGGSAATLAAGLGDWADALMDEKAIKYPTGSDTNRPLWEPMADYKGMQVVVDDKGRPVQGYKNGKAIDLSEDDIAGFVESGAGATAKNQFTGAKNAAFKLADVVSDIYLMRAMGGGTKLGTVASSFATTHRQSYDDAVNQLGMSGAEAAQYAMISAGLNGLIEAYVGDIETNPLKLSAAKAVGLKEARALVGKATAYDIAKAAFKPIMKSIGEENAEELIQGATQNYVNKVYNASTGSDFDESSSWSDLGETILMTTVATALTGGGDAAKQGLDEYSRGALHAAVQNPAALQKALDQLVSTQAITGDEAIAVQDRVDKLSDVYNRLPADMPQAKKEQVVDLELQKLQVADQYGGTESTAYQQIVDNTEKDVDNQIEAIVTGEPLEGEPGGVAVKKETATPTEEEIFVEPAPKADRIKEARVVAPEERDVPAFEEVVPDTRTKMGAVMEAYAPVAAEVIDMEALQADVDNSTGEARTAAENRLNAAVRQEKDLVMQNQRRRDALLDDATNAALSYLPPSVRNEVQPTDIQGLRNYLADHLMDPGFVAANSGQSFLRTVQDLTEEYAYDNIGDRSVNKTLSNRFQPQTVEDHIADAFLSGAKVSQVGLESDLPAEMKDGQATRLAYASRNGQGLDELAADIYQKMNGGDATVGTDMGGMGEVDIKNRIIDFIRENPSGPGNYVRESLDRASQEEMNRYAGEEVEPQAVAENVKKAESITAAMDKKDTASLGAVLDEYAAEDGSIDEERLMADYEAWDPFENPIPVFQNLTPKAKEALDEIKSGSNQQTSGASVQEQPQVTQNETGQVNEPGPGELPNEAQAGEETPVEPEGADVVEKAMGAVTPEEIDESLAEVDSALESAPMPEALTIPMVQAMRDDRVIDNNDAMWAIRFLNGQTSEQATSAYDRVFAARENLRVVPETNTMVGSDRSEPVRLPVPELTVNQDGEVLVSNGDQYAVAFTQIGGTLDPVTGKWSFPAGSESAVLLALSEQSTSAEDHVADVRSAPSMNSEVSSLLGRAGAILKRRSVKSRMKAAGSFSERLAIAVAEHSPALSKQEKALQRILKRLKRAFPGITIVTDPTEIDRVKARLVAENKMTTGRVLGFEYEGVVYVDPRVAGPETAVHELGHVWNSWLRVNQPTVYARGIELANQSDTINAILGNNAYGGLTEEQAAEEALATAIGQQGAIIGNTDLVTRLQNFLEEMWSAVGRAFGFAPRNMTLRQFAAAQAKTMLSGRAIMSDSSARLRELNEQIDAQAKFQIIGEIGARAIAGKTEGLAMAGQMELEGKNPNQIWAATGWERGADGKWKTEIEYGVVKPDGFKSGKTPLLLEDIFDAPRLYEAYPDLAKTFVFLRPEIPIGRAYVDSAGNINLSPQQINGPEGSSLDLLAHEIQHLVQEAEGFARGGTISNELPLEVKTAVESIVADGFAGNVDDWLAKQGAFGMTNKEMLEEMDVLDEVKTIAGLSENEIKELLRQWDEKAYTTYLNLSGEVEARNAGDRATGVKNKELPPRKTEDVPRPLQTVRFHAENDYSVAANMEKMGRPGEEINAVTGWHRDGDGLWRYDPMPENARLLVSNLLRSDVPAVVVGDIVSWPDMDMVRPEAMQMEFDFGDVELITVKEVDGKPTIVVPEAMSIDDMLQPLVLAVRNYVQAPVAPIEQIPMTDLAPEENKAFNGKNKDRARLHAASGDAEAAGRLLTATDLIREEIRAEGQAERTKKILRIANDLGLNPIDVYNVWEKESEAAGTGKIVLYAGSLPSSEKPLRTWMEKQWKKTRKLAKKKFGVMGLMDERIYAEDQKRLGRTAGLLKRGTYLMQHLEREMKAEYGKDLDDNHWRMVDNVLRDTGDYEVLPPAIRDATRAMRNFQDMISQELVKSGAIGGEMLLTVLTNSGVLVGPQIEDYHGVNVQKAMAKLPFERTEIEHVAIDDFINEFGQEIGGYMYRSYRKHDDDEWAEKVSPRVVAEARQFLIDDYTAQIAQREQERDAKIADIDGKIEQATADITAITNALNLEVENAKAKLEELQQQAEDFQDEKGSVNKNIERSFVAWQKKLKGFIARAKKGEEMVLEDFDVIDTMARADFDRLMVPAKQIVKLRRDILAMRKAQTKISDIYENKILETLYHRLQNVDGEMKQIVTAEKAPVSQLSRGLLGGKDMNQFRGRKDIPEPIRELMGEYHDPRVNFAKSIYRSVNTLQNQIFVTELRERYADELFFPRLTGDATVQLAAESSDALAPLNGWYTTPEIAEVFKDYYSVPPTPDAWLNLILKMSSAIKYGKTILSPVTHARNFFGNLWFVVNNGYDIRHAGVASQAFRDAWGKKMTAEQEGYFVRLSELGLVGEGANMGDLRALLAHLNQDKVEEFFRKYLGRERDDFRKKIEQTYGAEDDFYKIMAFETEKARYAQAIYGAPFESLTPAEQRDLERRAADIVTSTLPTYSKVPAIVRDIQRFPFTGTFVAFPAEMFRVTANQMKLIRTELRDPRLRPIGIRRMIGAAMAQAGLSIGLTAMFKFLSGVDDKEDDAARSFMYEWQQDATILWKELKPGEEMAFVNLSYTDPYSFLKRPVIRLLTDTNKGFMSQLGEVGYNFVQPFVSSELTTGTIGQLIYNKNTRTGSEIYNERMGILGDWKSTYRFMAWNLQPGVVKFTQDAISAVTQKPIGNRAPKQVSDVLLSLPGLQVERRNIETAFSTKARSLEKQKDWARAFFTSNRSLVKNDKEKLDSLYKQSFIEYNEVLKDTKFVIESAEKLGLTSQKINEVFKDVGMNTREITAARTGNHLAPIFEGYNKPAKK